MNQGPVRVLLVEDNAGDVLLVRRALEKQCLTHDLVVARNGEEAMRLLHQAETGPRDGVPELILLDLNLPRVDGCHILSHIRGTEVFATTTVIILSSSDSPRDRESALAQGANRYFRKPTDLQSFMQLGRIVKETLDNFRS